MNAARRSSVPGYYRTHQSRWWSSAGAGARQVSSVIHRPYFERARGQGVEVQTWNRTSHARSRTPGAGAARVCFIDITGRTAGSHVLTLRGARCVLGSSRPPFARVLSASDEPRPFTLLIKQMAESGPRDEIMNIMSSPRLARCTSHQRVIDTARNQNSQRPQTSAA